MSQRNAFSILGIVLLLAACGTGETISFKGVPLDQPGVKDALKKICQESQNNKDDRCSFNEPRELMWVSYGVLSHKLAWVTLGKDDSLVEIEISGTKGEMLAQVETLTAKYGKPAKTTEQVTNGFGTKFDKEIFTWTDSRGSRITVESIYAKVNEGRIVIDSASSVEAKKAAEKSLIKAGKENL
ncbi:hypothetical protein [Methylotuvimicrobium sp. KM1]|uniref:hypothetical protein n=1 Tax=Methylotuvimicrobium sp. KM1 TaxID=3377707 RepID=UPI00384D1F8F